MPTVIYQRTVSDTNVRTILQRIADHTGRDVTVHSGDRDFVPSGGSNRSLHIQKRAADFHIPGMTDAAGFSAMQSAMNQIFDAIESYEVIHHGQYTETGGEHLHLGRYGANRSGYVDFKTEGLVEATKGVYSRNRVQFSNANGVPVAPSQVNSAVNAGAGNPTNILNSVGLGGVNSYNDIILIQSLLNLARRNLLEAQIPFERFNVLREDGDCGSNTRNAIKIFQRDIVGMGSPDSRIDPGGRTLQMLYVAAYNPSDKTLRRVNRSKTLTQNNGRSNTGSGASAINLAAARRLLETPQVRAMLETIAYSEGTRRDHGGKEYGTIVHGVVTRAPYNTSWVGQSSNTLEITNFSRYPNMMVRVRPDLHSSATGRYQFIKRTWEWIAGYGLGDFSPGSQDLAAVMLMQYRGMIDPLLNGNFDQAVNNGSEEWASLPKAGGGGVYSGQRAHSVNTLRTVYQTALEQQQR